MKRMVVLTFLVLAGVLIWIVAFTLKFSLERRVIPSYPARAASLRQILNYYESELAKQGMDVQIRVVNETGYDEQRDVSGIGGNGYIFLNVVEKVFDTEIKYGFWRKITIGGVGSKSRRQREGGRPEPAALRDLGMDTETEIKELEKNRRLSAKAIPVYLGFFIAVGGALWFLGRLFTFPAWVTIIVVSITAFTLIGDICNYVYCGLKLRKLKRPP